jgi:hypothetical protein
MNQSEAVKELDFEDAYEQANRLVNKARKEIGSMTIFSGDHPEYGNVHIIIPVIGAAILLLPFATQVF